MYETHYLQRTAHAPCGCYSAPFMQGHRTLPATPHAPTHLATGFLTKYFALGSLKKRESHRTGKGFASLWGGGEMGRSRGYALKATQFILSFPYTFPSIAGHNGPRWQNLLHSRPKVWMEVGTMPGSLS